MRIDSAIAWGYGNGLYYTKCHNCCHLLSIRWNSTYQIVRGSCWKPHFSAHHKVWDIFYLTINFTYQLITKFILSDQMANIKSLTLTSIVNSAAFYLLRIQRLYSCVLRLKLLVVSDGIPCKHFISECTVSVAYTAYSGTTLITKAPFQYQTHFLV